MTRVLRVLRLEGLRAYVRSRPGAKRVPAVLVVCLYIAMLLCIPSVLIFRPLGAPGTPANMLGMVALAWWVCATLGGQNPIRGLTPTRVGAALMAVAILIPYANGTATGWFAPPAVRSGIDNWTLLAPTVDEINAMVAKAADRGLLSVVGWLGIMLLAAEGMRSWRDIDTVVNWVSWLAAFMAGLGIIQFFTGLDIAGLFQIPGLSANSDFGAVASRSVLNRVASTAAHPIEYGVVLAALFPLALHRTIFRWGERYALLPTFLIGLGMFLSVSRGAVVAVLCAFLVLLIGWPARWKLRALAILPFAVVGLRVAVPGLVGTLLSFFVNADKDPSVEGRTQDYAAVHLLWGEHPWFGRGLFTLMPQYYRILDNEYLLLLVELGAIGLSMFLIALLIGYFCARGTHHHAADERSRNVGLSISAGLFGLLVAHATFDGLGFPMAAGVTFLLTGLGGATWRLTRLGVPPEPELERQSRTPVLEGAA
ncbi:O-antigen ligase family protein [Nocardioides sp. CER19]|uniref:O-antigen ligase family protein n=1 Tax=Nocardioides sp. CER19 TaxID=3038538 RepID=UPI00244CB6A9|nr:O-antigen ligase family protein [Nocardioides sp. CER19]MDH2414828.1 O-antigen ligase family protein [Nocardioides sp. CER19]